jgi:Rrf2 family protein
MQLTTKTEYSVRALVLLSESRDSLISINEICKRQNLPNKYIEQLFRKLKKSEIIGSIPGSKGGYYLKIPALCISLGRIMEVVENHPYETSCERNNMEFGYCPKADCEYKIMWHEIYGNIRDYLATITLNDIKKRINKG